MENPATKEDLGYNEFTYHVMNNPGIIVTLRNGKTAQPVLSKIKDTDRFCFAYHGLTWNLGGVCFQSRAHDMMAVEDMDDGDEES